MPQPRPAFRALAAAAAIAAAATVMPAAVVAQTNADENDAALEVIIVTAKKREQNINEVAAAISAFTPEALERQGAVELLDVGKFVPNLNITTFSAGHTQSVNPFIRGIGLQDHLIFTDPGVSVYVDGVYLGRQVGQNWSLANIERVEVLRGPQGTLLGRNSIGGAINIITRKPGRESAGRVSMEAGTRQRINTDIYGNLPLGENFAVSLGGAFKRRDGVGDFLNLPDTNVRVGEMQDISGRLAAKWSVNEDVQLLFTADANSGRNGLNPYTTFIDELPNGAPYRAGLRNSDVAADPYDNNTGQAGQTRVRNQASGVSLTVDWQNNENLQTKLIISDRRSKYTAGLDDDSTERDYLSFPEQGRADQTSAELQFTGDFQPVDFVAGLYYFTEEGRNYQPSVTFNGGAGGVFDIKQDLTSAAVYANAGYTLPNELRFSGGLRYTKDEKEADVNINNFLRTASARSWNELSWDIAASYPLGETLTAYANVANGYQSGAFPARPYCLFGSVDTTLPGNVSTPNCLSAGDHITAVNYEIGLKGIIGERISFSAAVFLTNYSDLPYQASDTTSGGFNTVNVIVDQQSIGAEWEGRIKFSEWFSLDASLGYIDTDPENPEVLVPLTPEFTAAVGPEFRWNTAGGGNVTLRGDYSYRGEMFGEPSRNRRSLSTIAARDLVNVNLTYHSAAGNWRAALYGRNIADERYSNARLNTGDYVLDILSNDASEFGVRLVREF